MDSSSGENVIKSAALSVQQLQQFFAGMPDREVVVRYVDHEETVKFSTVTGWLKGLSDKDFVTDASNRQVLGKAEKSRGYMRLTFYWRFWLLLKLYQNELESLRNDELGKLIDETITIAYSKYEAGLAYSQLKDLLPSLIYCRVRLGQRFADAPIASLIGEPLALIRKAITVWEECPSLDIKFWGGGFGANAATQGMLTAFALNEATKWVNRSLRDQPAKQVEFLLQEAVQQLLATQMVIRESIR